jgi:transposase
MPTTIKTRIRPTPRRRSKSANAQGLPIIDPDTAGLDIGATEVYAAVQPDRDPQPVRCFSTFTDDLLALADWLRACGVRAVAMEATGVYWIPVFQILAAAGFDVCLVNPRHVKNVRGRKTDVSDCQWLQHLHAVGLLHPSFRPPDEICALRTIYRHRSHLVRQAAEQIQLMQKSLTQMNLHLHHVLSDLAGVSGLRIVDAILAGERDPTALAGLRDPRVKTDEATLVAALTGDWRVEHLFTLQQARLTFTHYHELMRACDAEIERWLRDHPSPAASGGEPPLAVAGGKAPTRGRVRRRTSGRNEPILPTLDLAAELHHRFGVDLTAVPTFEVATLTALYAELGADLSAFPTSKHFASWLALCPDPRKSGGKILQNHTRDVRHRVAQIFRQAAQSAARSDHHLGAFYRRIRGKLGGPQAVTATAHKLARIFYHLVTTKEPYQESAFELEEQLHRERRLRNLHRQAKALGFALEPIQVS